MVAKKSAGVILYRYRGGALEVLLGYPGGPYYEGKPDAGVWSVPKGEPGPGETDMESVARREFAEETGLAPSGPLIDLGTIVQRGGKEVSCWAVQGDLDPADARSNLFEMEWPPHSGRIGRFPEIDRVAWFGSGEARLKIRAAQIPLLERLEHILRA